ncbi:MAG TPA: hypothetical protein VMF66_10315 [Candidatus Acidoferrum sp.]|nr:hypothetical protein [Candidatus Acidoferrum sp.]
MSGRPLDQVCANPDACREIESLIAARDRGEQVLETQSVSVAETLSGRTSGPYEILAPLGAGGMGIVFSLEHSQNPLFRMLGTPDAEKEHVVLETPHDVTQQRPELIHIVLAWLDKYLGRVD